MNFGSGYAGLGIRFGASSCPVRFDPARTQGSTHGTGSPPGWACAPPLHLFCVCRRLDSFSSRENRLRSPAAAARADQFQTGLPLGRPRKPLPPPRFGQHPGQPGRAVAKLLERQVDVAGGRLRALVEVSVEIESRRAASGAAGHGSGPAAGRSRTAPGLYCVVNPASRSWSSLPEHELFLPRRLPPPSLVVRLDAAVYEAPRNTREKSDEWAKAELAASYATINRTTAIPATYVPPVSATNPDMAEKWAKQLETPGGMAEVSRDITSVELAYKADRTETQREMRQERTQQRNEQRQQETQQAHGHKPVQPGGDPGVETPAARPASGPAQSAPSQERDQAQPAH